MPGQRRLWPGTWVVCRFTVGASRKANTELFATVAAFARLENVFPYPQLDVESMICDR